MNAQIYNAMLEESASIASFFRDQPGGELCLALFFDICQSLVEKEDVDGLESVIETVYKICELPRLQGGINEEWSEIFVEMIEMQFSHKD